MGKDHQSYINGDISKIRDLKCLLHFGGKTLEAKLDHFNFRGASIYLGHQKKIPIPIKGREKYIKFDLILGKRIIKRDVDYKVVWDDSDKTRSFGVEFLVKDSEFTSYKKRMVTHPLIIPTLKTRDPFEPGRYIFFSVQNLSSNGMMLTSSLRNKHLFPGMTLRKSSLCLPGDEPILLDLVIKNTRVGDKPGWFHLGCKVKKPSQSYFAKIQNYVILFGNLSTLAKSEARQEILDDQNAIEEGLSFKTVSSDDEYSEVLALRAIMSLKQQNILSSAQRVLSDKATTIAGYLNGQIICSFELRMSSLGHQSWITEVSGHGQFPGEVVDDNVLEISQLNVHPSGRKTAIFVAIYQRLYGFCTINGMPKIMISVPLPFTNLFRSMGFQEVGLRFPHPDQSEVHLSVMIGSSEIYKHCASPEKQAKKILLGLNNRSFVARCYLFYENCQLKIDWMSKKAILGYLKAKELFEKKRSFVLPNWMVQFKQNSDPRLPFKSPPTSLTDQHIAAPMINSYLVEAENRIGKDLVDEILYSMGFHRHYFFFQANWVGIDFLDSFLDRYSIYGDVAELSCYAGKRLVSKDIIGANYILMNHLPSIKIGLKSIPYLFSKLNKTRTYRWFRLSSREGIIGVGLAPGRALSKHLQSCQQWEMTLLAVVQLISGRPAKVRKISCCYQGDPECLYALSWKKSTNRLLWACLIAITFGINFAFFDDILKENFSWIEVFTTSAFLFFIFTWFLGRLCWRLFNEKSEIETEIVKIQEDINAKYLIHHDERKKNSLVRKQVYLIDGIALLQQKNLSFSRIIQVTLEMLRQQFHMDRIFLMVKSGQELEVKYDAGNEKYGEKKIACRVHLSARQQNIFSLVFQYRQSILVDQASGHRFQIDETSQEIIHRLQLKRFAVVALPASKGSWGILIFSRAPGFEVMSGDDLDVLNSVALHLGQIYRWQGLEKKQRDLQQSHQIPNMPSVPRADKESACD